MHSKVIIASLICALAASFNNGKFVTNSFSKTNHSVEGGVSCAPNEEHATITIDNPCGNAGVTFSATIECGHYLGSGVTVANCTPGFYVTNFVQNYSVTVILVVPNQPGDYVIEYVDNSFGQNIKLGKVYAFSDGVHYYASSLSANDARARFFMEYMATSTEIGFLDNGREYYSVPETLNIARNNSSNGTAVLSNEVERLVDRIAKPFDPQIPIVSNNPKYYAPTMFDAEKRFGEFVYGTRDITTTRSITSSIGYNRSTTLRLHVNWVDKDGNSHPLSGMYADFLNPADHSIVPNIYNTITNSNGVFEVVIPKNVGNNYFLNEIQFRIASVNRATYVEDFLMNNYPYCYSQKSNVMQGVNYAKLSSYSAVDYYVTVRPNRSDRAAAYEICQAQALPYDYAQAFSSGINQARTVYPSNSTDYYVLPRNNCFIEVQKEDYNSWDVLNHEYGHHIENMHSLCCTPNYNDSSYSHTVHQNLNNSYGASVGEKLAFCEGLATYLGIASQLYFKENNPDVNIPDVGDENYRDSFRNLTVNYDVYAPGKNGSNIIQIEAVESAITSVMLKLLDDASRYCDYVKLGHQKMWRTLLGNCCYTFNEWINRVMPDNVTLHDNINYILDLERNYYNIPHQIQPAEWTIMIYMCGADLETNDECGTADIEEILKVDDQPDNVNIIIQTGGAYAWHYEGITSNYTCRFHVRNKTLIRDYDLDDTCREDMGDYRTFERFLDWGLTNYPAEKTGVVFWGHGGALDGCCVDERTHSLITNSQSASVFDCVFRSHDIEKLEFVGYDCCFMQLQDVAEFNSHYFNYMIASEEKEGPYGWKYDEWLDNLYNGESTSEILEEICNTYIGYSGYESRGTLSVLDLSKMSYYRAEFEYLASAIRNDVVANFAAFKAIINDAYHFESYDTLGTIDGLSFFTRLINSPIFSQYSSLIESTVDCYRDMIAFTRTHDNVAGIATGMAIHVCLEEEHYYPENDTNFVIWRSLFPLALTQNTGH